MLGRTIAIAAACAAFTSSATRVDEDEDVDVVTFDVDDDYYGAEVASDAKKDDDDYEPSAPALPAPAVLPARPDMGPAKLKRAFQTRLKGGHITLRREVTLTDAEVSQAEGDASNPAWMAIDGDSETFSRTQSCHAPWWQVILPFKTQITDVHVTFPSKGQGKEEPPVTVMVDGVTCATISDWRVGVKQKIPCKATGTTVKLVQMLINASMEISEVQIIEKAQPTCPFMGTLINEGVIKNCIVSRHELLKYLLDSGLSKANAEGSVNANFAHIPSGYLDVCNMEGMPCEHKYSTGILDCMTHFGKCTKLPSSEVVCPQNWTEPCELPNRKLFDNFVKVIDKDGDCLVTRAELAAGTPNVFKVEKKSWDYGKGTIAGGFNLLIDLFGKSDRISCATLTRVVMDMRFPNGYTWGIRHKPKPTNKCTRDAYGNLKCGNKPSTPPRQPTARTYYARRRSRYYGGKGYRRYGKYR